METQQEIPEYTVDLEMQGLNPENYIGKVQRFEFSYSQNNSCLTSMNKKSKEGKEYKQYTLWLWDYVRKTEVCIRYLFNRDLQAMLSVSKDIKKWQELFKHVDVSATKDGNYNRWIIVPVMI